MIDGVYDFLIKCLSILFVINSIIMLVLSFKLRVSEREKSSGNEIQDETISSIGIYGTVICLIAGLSFVGGCLFLAFGKGVGWLILFFTAPYYLKLISSGLLSANTINSIVRDTNYKKLTFHEKSAIIVLAAIFLLCHQFGFINTIKSGLCVSANAALINVGVCAVHIFLYFGVFFFGIVFLQTPILLLANIYIRVLVRLPTSFKHKYYQLIKDTDGPARTSFWCLPIVAHAKKAGFPWKQLIYMCIPLIVGADFIMTLLAYFGGAIKEALVYLLQIILQIAKVLYKLAQKLQGISDRHCVAMAFRVAVVAAMTSVVIINRLDPILSNTEESTAILEFIASAVVIPVIYAWINMWLAKRKQAKCNSV